MKAVILAGGEGSRMRPLTPDMPKAMLPLLGRPVLLRAIAHLQAHGFTQIAVTMGPALSSVRRLLGDGRELGVELAWFPEPEPLGTAGAISACAPWLGDQDFLVMECGLFSLDLSAAVGFHRAGRADATLALSHFRPSPDRPAVLTDDAGRVTSIVPEARGIVCASYGGVCILTRRALDRIPPQRPFSLVHGLLPLLLREGAALRAFAADGCQLTPASPEDYLGCLAAALEGKVRLDRGLPKRGPGVWAAEALPPGVTAIPPCWIGPGVTLESGSLIGPHAVLEQGASVGPRSLIQRSVLMENARVGGRCTLYGAVLAPGAEAGEGCVLNEGALLGAGAAAGPESVLMEGVRVWPGQQVPPGARQTVSLIHGGGTPVGFREDGVIRGGSALTPQLLLTLGAILGGEGSVGLGWGGGPWAQTLARCAGSGAAAAGAEVLLHDGGCPSAGAWAAERYALPVSLFVLQNGGGLSLYFFDRRGLPLSRPRQRRLEAALLRGEARRAFPGRAGSWTPISGLPAAYAADAARRVWSGPGGMTPVAVSVPGHSPACRILAAALEAQGCVVLRRQADGVPGFSPEHGGLGLSAWDEAGTSLPVHQLLSVLSLIEWENGGGCAVLPPGGPEFLRSLARSRGARLLVPEEEGWEDLYAALPWFRDGIFAAGRICARLGRTGERLSTLAGRVPRFAVLRRDLPLPDAEALERLSGVLGQPAGSPLRAEEDGGIVRLVPLFRRAALRVAVEAADLETAEELWRVWEKKLRNLTEK